MLLANPLAYGVAWKVPLATMYVPPAETTSGCWPGNPQCPFPAENTTMIPLAHASAIAAAMAWLAAERGGFMTLDPQLLLMIWGPSATAALNPPTVLTKLIFTMVKSTSGATAKMFADSPVPWPTSSAAAFAAPGPRTTGEDRYPRWVKKGCLNQPESVITTLTFRPVMPPRWARSAFMPRETSPGTRRCQ